MGTKTNLNFTPHGRAAGRPGGEGLAAVGGGGAGLLLVLPLSNVNLGGAPSRLSMYPNNHN